MSCQQLAFAVQLTLVGALCGFALGRSKLARLRVCCDQKEHWMPGTHSPIQLFERGLLVCEFPCLSFVFHSLPIGISDLHLMRRPKVDGLRREGWAVAHPCLCWGEIIPESCCQVLEVSRLS